MPPAGRRSNRVTSSRAEAVAISSSPPAAGRNPAESAAQRKRKREAEPVKNEVDRKDELEDAFADEFDSMVMDLSNTDKVPLQLSRPKPKNEVKLSAYQCVICMDDVSGLTVTHCGTFTAECGMMLS